MCDASLRNIVVAEEDVVVPDRYRAMALGLEPALWKKHGDDAVMICLIAPNADIAEIVRLLDRIGGLGCLLGIGSRALQREAAGILAAEDCERITASQCATTITPVHARS